MSQSEPTFACAIFGGIPDHLSLCWRILAVAGEETEEDQAKAYICDDCHASQGCVVDFADSVGLKRWNCA